MTERKKLQKTCDPKVRMMQSTNHHFTKNKTKSNIFTTKINLSDPTWTLTQKMNKQKGQKLSYIVSSEQILLLRTKNWNQLKKNFKMFQHQQISAISVITRHNFKPKSLTAEVSVQQHTETVCWLPEEFLREASWSLRYL